MKRWQGIFSGTLMVFAIGVNSQEVQKEENQPLPKAEEVQKEESQPLPKAVGGYITGKITAKGVRDARDVVIFIEEVPGEFPPSEEHSVINQKNLIFTPHILPILVGTTVDFPNSDNIRHNVLSPSKAKRFNLGTYAQGVTRSVTFEETGEVALLCNVHPEMSAYLLVLQNPYFAVTDTSGRYTIENVPPGEYVLKTWHEKLKPQSQTVVIPETPETVVDFKLKR
ncbi:carboxypeptidase regulatory-like domain-containing protein [candidate division TA06 bacterium]|nr:carboxypeptidase regulatory-like domain-containing protein [candidate division TA06 bacterium]